MPANNKRNATLLLERVRLGEVETAAAALALGLEEDVLREKLLALDQESAEQLKAHPPALFAAQVRAKQSASSEAATPRPFLSNLWLFPAAAAAAALLLFVFDEPPAERTKGMLPPSISIIDAHGRRLMGGELVKAGDRVQPIVRSGGRAFVAVFSVDGRGHVTQHHPQPLAAWTSLASPNKAFRLPIAIELDDAPKHETFVLIAAETKFDLDQARLALQTGARAGRAPVLVGATASFKLRK